MCGPLCPTFRLASRSARYDIRLYPRTLWVSYVTVTENRLLAEMEARAGLTEFLAGRNSHGERRRLVGRRQGGQKGGLLPPGRGWLGLCAGRTGVGGVIA